MKNIRYELSRNEIGQNASLQDQQTGKPRERQIRGAAGALLKIVGKIAKSAAKTAKTSASTIKRVSKTSWSKLKLAASGATRYNFRHQRLGVGAWGRMKSGMRTLMKKAGKVSTKLSGPLLLFLTANEISEFAQDMAGQGSGPVGNPVEYPEEEIALVPRALDDFKPDESFQVISLDLNDTAILIAPNTDTEGSLGIPMRLTSTSKILDFSTVRNVVQKVYKNLGIIRKGADLINYLLRGGVLTSEGHKENDDKEHQSVISWHNPSTNQIFQKILTALDTTKINTYHSGMMIPSGSTQMSTDFVYSEARDQDGVTFDSMGASYECAKQLAQGKMVPSCVTNRPPDTAVSYLESSPTYLMVRLIAQSPWSVILVCPASNLKYPLDLEPISVILLHKQCALEYKNGKKIVEDKESYLFTEPLSLPHLYKVVYQAENLAGWYLPYITWSVTAWAYISLLGVGMFPCVWYCHKKRSGLSKSESKKSISSDEHDVTLTEENERKKAFRNVQKERQTPESFQTVPSTPTSVRQQYAPVSHSRPDSVPRSPTMSQRQKLVDLLDKGKLVL